MINSVKDRDNLLLLDTGNLLLSDDKVNYPAKRKTTVEAMKMLQYDGLGLGINEIAKDTDFVPEICKKDLFPLISANIKSDDHDFCIQKYIVTEKKGIKFGITSVLPPQHADIIKPDPLLTIEDPRAALESILPELKEKSDFVILLSSLTASQTSNLANGVPGIDLAVCSDTRTLRLPSPAELKLGGKPFVLSFINRGIELGKLTITKADNKTAIENISRVALNQDIRSDKKILDLLEKYTEELRYLLKARADEKKLDDRFKTLEMSPEDFFKQLDKNGNQTKEQE